MNRLRLRAKLHGKMSQSFTVLKSRKTRTCVRILAIDPFAVRAKGVIGLWMSNHKDSPSVGRGAVPVAFSGVLETALYVDDLDAAERFYMDVLGLTKISSIPGRMLAFRCQESILLLFNPQHTDREPVVVNGGAIPLHGARGAGHMAFRLAKSELEALRQHFRAAGVAVESEVSWPNGAHSIYFRDPAGNSLEVATPDMWTKANS